MEKSAGIALEFKDLDTSKRTAVIRHSVYGSMDRVNDISCKGMFTRSWGVLKPDFLFNHKDGATIGNTLKTFEDDSGAYTEVKFGTWTLANDVLEMADAGVLKGASFGYVTEKKEFGNVNGVKVRKLKEVRHIETSLLTMLPAHPEAGVVLLNKSLNEIEEVSELLEWHNEYLVSLKSYIQKVDNYCRNAQASDESIIALQNSLTEYKQIISDFGTTDTRLIPDQSASDDEVKNQLNNFLTSFNLRQWQRKPLASN